MMGTRNSSTSVLILLLLMGLCSSGAAWENDFQINNQIYDTGSSPGSVRTQPDGSGGVYIVWMDYRDGQSPDVYAQHLDADGQRLWDSNGILLVDNDSFAQGLDITTTRNGDLWLALAVDEALAVRVRFQRVSPAGTLGFHHGGVLVTPVITSVVQAEPAIVADGVNGVVIVWEDSRNEGFSETDLWAQRVNSSGLLQWSSYGKEVCGATSFQSDPQVVLSERGSPMIFWNDLRDYGSTDTDIYGARLDADGEPLWVVDGVGLCTAYGYQRLSDAQPDGHGGALLAWDDERDTDTQGKDIYVSRVRPADGRFHWLNNGSAVCALPDNQYGARLAADGVGGMFVVWHDVRSDSYDGISMYAQHLFANGSEAWQEDGVLMLYRHGSCYIRDGGVHMTEDGDLIIAAILDESAMVGVKVTETLSRPWGSDGTIFSNWNAGVFDYRICTDGDGGILGVWTDYRNSDAYSTIYAQRVDRWGVGGAPEPELIAVDDRPADQGGEVILTWDRSPFDTYGDPLVDHYTAWMRQSDPVRIPAALIEEAEVDALSERAGLSRTQALAMLETGWAYIGAQDAWRFETYSLHAPTYGDSTGASQPLTTYKVMAHDTGTGAFWPSNENVGWSVDNLAPGAPLALVAELDGAAVDLDWDASGQHDEDLAEYHVHRSDVAGFTPSPATFVGATTEVLFTDTTPPIGVLYYVVAAVDVHGNQGGPSNEVQVHSVTAVGDGGLPRAFTLRSASPNPFNPTTSLCLDVPMSGTVRVEIYDARGSRVRVLHDGPLAAGHRTLSWRGVDDDGHALPSGVYLARAMMGGTKTALKLMLAR